MKLLNILQNIFKVEEPVPRSVEPQPDFNSITFSIDGFNRQSIVISLNNKNTESCEKFAQMLFDLNNGNYEQNILDNIVAISKQKPDLVPSIEHLLIAWGAAIAAADKQPELPPNKMVEADNRPFIRPRNVFLGSSK